MQQLPPARAGYGRGAAQLPQKLCQFPALAGGVLSSPAHGAARRGVAQEFTPENLAGCRSVMEYLGEIARTGRVGIRMIQVPETAYFDFDDIKCARRHSEFLPSHDMT